MPRQSAERSNRATRQAAPSITPSRSQPANRNPERSSPRAGIAIADSAGDASRSRGSERGNGAGNQSNNRSARPNPPASSGTPDANGGSQSSVAISEFIERQRDRHSGSAQIAERQRADQPRKESQANDRGRNGGSNDRGSANDQPTPKTGIGIVDNIDRGGSNGNANRENRSSDRNAITKDRNIEQPKTGISIVDDVNRTGSKGGVKRENRSVDRNGTGSGKSEQPKTGISIVDDIDRGSNRDGKSNGGTSRWSGRNNTNDGLRVDDPRNDRRVDGTNSLAFGARGESWSGHHGGSRHGGHHGGRHHDGHHHDSWHGHHNDFCSSHFSHRSHHHHHHNHFAFSVYYPFSGFGLFYSSGHFGLGLSWAPYYYGGYYNNCYWPSNHWWSYNDCYDWNYSYCHSRYYGCWDDYRWYSYRPYYSCYRPSYRYYYPVYSSATYYDDYSYPDYYDYSDYSDGYLSNDYLAGGTTSTALPPYVGDPNQGWDLLEIGDAREARRLFDMAINAYPADGLPQVGYALSAAMLDRDAEAALYMRRALREDPESLDEVPWSAELEQRVLQPLITEYTNRSKASPVNPDDLVMLAAMQTLAGDHAMAYFSADRVTDMGDQDAAALNLKRMIEQALQRESSDAPPLSLPPVTAPAPRMSPMAPTQTQPATSQPTTQPGDVLY